MTTVPVAVADDLEIVLRAQDVVRTGQLSRRLKNCVRSRKCVRQMGRIGRDKIQRRLLRLASSAIFQISVDRPPIFLFIFTGADRLKHSASREQPGQSRCIYLILVRDSQPVAISDQEREKWVVHPRPLEIFDVITADAGEHGKNSPGRRVSTAPMLAVELDLEPIAIPGKS